MSTLPAHVNEGALWADWFRGDRSLIDIALAHSLPVATLIAWARSPAVRAICDALREVAAQRADDLTAIASAGAIGALAKHTTTTCDTPLAARILESRRKAATALLPRCATRAPGPAHATRATRPTQVARSNTGTDTTTQTSTAPPVPQKSDIGAPTRSPDQPAPSRTTDIPPLATILNVPTTTRRRCAATLRQRAGAVPAPT